MSKKSAIIFGIVLAAVALVAWGYASLTGPHGKLITQLQKKDGYTHTVSVRQFARRFRTELGEQGVHGRVLPISTYEFMRAVIQSSQRRLIGRSYTDFQSTS